MTYFETFSNMMTFFFSFFFVKIIKERPSGLSNPPDCKEAGLSEPIITTLVTLFKDKHSTQLLKFLDL
ncbi:MAG: hypothetical protein ABI554_12200 [Flavobacterium sp.]